MVSEIGGVVPTVQQYAQGSQLTSCPEDFRPKIELEMTFLFYGYTMEDLNKDVARRIFEMARELRNLKIDWTNLG